MADYPIMLDRYGVKGVNLSRTSRNQTGKTKTISRLRAVALQRAGTRIKSDELRIKADLTLFLYDQIFIRYYPTLSV